MHPFFLLQHEFWTTFKMYFINTFTKVGSLIHLCRLGGNAPSSLKLPPPYLSSYTHLVSSGAAFFRPLFPEFSRTLNFCQYKGGKIS